MSLFQELNDEGATILLVTHERTSPPMRGGPWSSETGW